MCVVVCIVDALFTVANIGYIVDDVLQMSMMLDIRVHVVWIVG